MANRRIVHLTSVHSAFDVRIFQKECRSLANAGFHVTIVVPHSKDEVSDGVRIRAVPQMNGEGRLHRMTATVWSVLREALSQNADLYHFHDPELMPVGLVLRAWGKKVIYDIHENVPQDILLKEYLPIWSRGFLSGLVGKTETFVSRFFSALVTVSPLIAARFASCNSRTVVVHNFPEFAELADTAGVPWETREPKVVFPGGILPERGIRQMIHAMACLPASSAATLEIACAEFPPNLWHELTGHPGWARVRYLGALNRKRICDLLSRASAGLVLYLPQGQNLCALPHKLFEYMAAGIPVIASDFPLWRQLLDGIDCALFVDPLKPQAIAEAIQYVLTHPDESARMGSRGREAVRHAYNWDSQARELIKLYTGLLGPPCVA